MIKKIILFSAVILFSGCAQKGNVISLVASNVLKQENKNSPSKTVHCIKINEKSVVADDLAGGHNLDSFSKDKLEYEARGIYIAILISKFKMDSQSRCSKYYYYKIEDAGILFNVTGMVGVSSADLTVKSKISVLEESGIIIFTKLYESSEKSEQFGSFLRSTYVKKENEIFQKMLYKLIVKNINDSLKDIIKGTVKGR